MLVYEKQWLNILKDKSPFKKQNKSNKPLIRRKKVIEKTFLNGLKQTLKREMNFGDTDQGGKSTYLELTIKIKKCRDRNLKYIN